MRTFGESTSDGSWFRLSMSMSITKMTPNITQMAVVMFAIEYTFRAGEISTE
jgi:hypothetical protein